MKMHDPINHHYLFDCCCPSNCGRTPRSPQSGEMFLALEFSLKSFLCCVKGGRSLRREKLTYTFKSTNIRCLRHSSIRRSSRFLQTTRILEVFFTLFPTAAAPSGRTLCVLTLTIRDNRQALLPAPLDCQDVPRVCAQKRGQLTPCARCEF